MVEGIKKIVEPALVELLQPAAEGKVYLDRAPDNETNDFVIIRNGNFERWKILNGQATVAQDTIQIDSYSSDSLRAKRLAAHVETILDNFKGTVEYGNDSPREFVKIAGISLASGVDLFEQTELPYMFRRTVMYTVTYRQ